jgi:hypothetical protein
MLKMKKINNISLLTLLIGVSILSSIVFSCAKEKVPTTVLDSSSCKPNVSYLNDIKSIMSNNCVSCHSSKNPSGGYDLTNYDGLTKNVSKVLGSMRQDGTAQSMPQGYKVADSLIQKLNCWINQGAKNN